MVKYAPKIERISKYTKEDIAEAKANGVSYSAFLGRIYRGYPREVALSHPPNKHFVGMERTAYKKTMALNFKERVYKNDKPKPWLEKYPQKTVRGEYCKHLWENDIFPKSRKVE